MTDKETRERELLELIADAENLATVHAKEYGEKYNSMHEAWAVLKEEVDEACEELLVVRHQEEVAYLHLLNGRVEGVKNVSKIAKERARHGIVELLHVIAVCNKIEAME